MSERYPFSLPALPFGYTDLMPYMKPETLYVHNNIILAKYVNKLNDLISQRPELQNWTLSQLITEEMNIPEYQKEQIKNCAGAIYNHKLYFDRMSAAVNNQPGPRLAHAINERYGSIDQFKGFVNQAAHSIFGNGWVWLNSERNGNIHIATTADNQTAAIDMLTPLAVLDTWEHAYYLQYPTQLNMHVATWLALLDWEKVEIAYVDSLTR